MVGYQEIDVTTLAQWIQEGKRFRLVDVRSVAEFAQGMIPQGEKMPLHTLPLHADHIETDIPVVFYCRTGARSAQACMFLAGRGLQNTYNLRGGIVDWIQQGKPLEAAA